MKFIFSSKKVVFVFCILLFLILLSAGFYFWIKNEINNERNDISTKSSDISEFEVKDINGEKIIENKKEGLLVKSPNGWIIKKFKYNDKENEVSLFSPESEFDEQGNFITKKSYFEKGACVIGMAVKKCEKYSSNVLTEADMIWGYIRGIIEESNVNNSSNKNWTVINISGKDSLKRVTKQDNNITSVRVEIPIGQTIYGFSTGYIINQNCLKAFDDFIKTVLLNK